MKQRRSIDIIVAVLICLAIACRQQPPSTTPAATPAATPADTGTTARPVKPVIIELTDTGAAPANIKAGIIAAGLDTAALYQWQNHTVLFDTVANTNAAVQQLQAQCKGCMVKLYDNLFYEFNRSHCDSGTIAKEWSHTILTANLVADTAKQHEYLDYHATQYQQWPEVSKGFCHAGFQQLLLYRNGRQLMLVISIPKGENLDRLNPKTTENNPRVNDWNNIMKQYQEGIPGTKPGETWVLLQHL